jgi:hypothetical protein
MNQRDTESSSVSMTYQGLQNTVGLQWFTYPSGLLFKINMLQNTVAGQWFSKSPYETTR